MASSGLVGSGTVRFGLTRSGQEWVERVGTVRTGEKGNGVVWYGVSWKGEGRQDWNEPVWLVLSRTGLVWAGPDRLEGTVECPEAVWESNPEYLQSA